MIVDESCARCGNDLPAEGHDLCLDCLEATDPDPNEDHMPPDRPTTLVDVHAAADLARRATEHRDAVIAAAIAAGYSLRSVADAAGISHTTAAAIRDAAAGGTDGSD